MISSVKSSTCPHWNQYYSQEYYITLYLLVHAAYLGVVGKKEAEVVFGVFWAVRGAGGAAMFFLSGFASVSVAVTILLIAQAIVFLCYFCAEYFYGEMKSSDRTTPNDTITHKMML